MNIQNIGAFKGARNVPFAQLDTRRAISSASPPPFNIPLEELRRLVAEMVD